jgi:hypothetical protein
MSNKYSELKDMLLGKLDEAGQVQPLQLAEEPEPIVSPPVELVDHPAHYNTGRFEAIDVIEDWDLNFHCASAIKYISRHKHKGQATSDIEKAIWYLNRYLMQMEAQK